MEYSVSVNGKFLKKGQMVGHMPEIPAELKVNPEDEIISGQWTNSEEMLQKLFFLQHGHQQMPDERYDFFEIAKSIKKQSIVRYEKCRMT